MPSVVHNAFPLYLIPKVQLKLDKFIELMSLLRGMAEEVDDLKTAADVPGPTDWVQLLLWDSGRIVARTKIACRKPC